MSILITGGAGYIGSHTSIELLKNGHDVVIIDNFSNSSEDVVDKIKKLGGAQLKCYVGDIRDEDFLKNIFDNNRITHVIHFAGLKSVSESLINPTKYYDNNVVGTIQLAKTMIAAKVPNLIFSSSATVYGKPQKIPLTEDCTVGETTNPYGKSKYITENILYDISQFHKDINITVLRYFNPVGAHPSGLIGESPNGIPNNLLPYLTKVVSGSLESLSIYGNDYPTKDGTGVRDYIHVMDLAEGHLAAINIAANNNFRVYNLGTGRGYSVLEVINTFEKVTGKHVNYHFAPRREGDIAECWSDPSLAYQQLKWKANRTLEQMLVDAWNWERNNIE
ncbi:UDP-glucose 4-epimerase GalE [Enterobacteriaceae bacterium]